jgi:hypothetical protein
MASQIVIEDVVGRFRIVYISDAKVGIVEVSGGAESSLGEI